MEKLSKVIGQNLATLRKKLHRTQELFSEASGIPQATVSRLESGIGLSVMDRLGDAVLQAGGDPMDLLCQEPNGAANADIAEIRRLLWQVDDDTRSYILRVLQREADLATRSLAKAQGSV